MYANISNLRQTTHPMIIVTGCNGFIGSNLVVKLNELGIKDIIGVDDLSKKDNLANIAHCEIVELLDVKDFENDYLDKNKSIAEVTHIFHQGACSDTMEWDAEYMMKNNYSISQWAILARLSFLDRSSTPTISLIPSSLSFTTKFEPIKPLQPVTMIMRWGSFA